MAPVQQSCQKRGRSSSEAHQDGSTLSWLHKVLLSVALPLNWDCLIIHRDAFGLQRPMLLIHGSFFCYNRVVPVGYA